MRSPLVLLTLGLAVATPTLALPTAAQAQKGPPDGPAPTWKLPPPPGVETVKPMKPTWCAGYKPRPWLPGNLVYDDVDRLGYSEELLEQIAQLACDRPDEPGRQQWIAFYRQGWLNIVGTSEKEDRAAMAARMSLRAARDAAAARCAPMYADKGLSPADAVFTRLRATAVGCYGPPTEITDGNSNAFGLSGASYWLDRAAEPPDELVRLSWVLRCLNPGASNVDPDSIDRALGRWSMCGMDAARLDRKKFDKEVAALGLDPLGQVRAREAFAYTRLLVASYQAALTRLRAKDPAYGRILDAAARGFADWVALRREHAAVLDQAFAMEDAFRDADPRTIGDCSGSLRKALQDHVAAVAPKTKDELVDALNDDVGQPVLKALIACDSMQGRYALSDTEHALLGSGRTRRGPRTAAFWATLDVVSEIAAEKFRFPVQPGNFGGPLPDRGAWMVAAWESTFNQIHWDRDQKGQVATVKAQGDGVMVTFKTRSWKEPVWKCKETNRVDRITPDGRVEYRQSCVAAGTQVVKETPRPAWIRKDLAAGIKPGVFVTMRLDTKPEPDQGYPLSVHADAGQTRLVQYQGFVVAP